MTRIVLLEELKKETERATEDLIMPVAMQKGDAEQQYRAAEVYKMRLPDSSSAKKKAPYIIHQIITGKDAQVEGQNAESTAVIRSIFTVYNDSSEEDGAMMLLNLMERLRVDLLRRAILANQFQLDLKVGVETIIYPDDTAPYYAGEMVTTWKLPSVEREVRSWL
jgi:hypothetical protein